MISTDDNAGQWVVVLWAAVLGILRALEFSRKDTYYLDLPQASVLSCAFPLLVCMPLSYESD